MSTGYGWERLKALRQVCATLLGARHVSERFLGGIVYLGRYNKMLSFAFFEGRKCEWKEIRGTGRDGKGK